MINMVPNIPVVTGPPSQYWENRLLWTLCMVALGTWYINSMRIKKVVKVVHWDVLELNVKIG